ncbi:circularly permuted type 2 ATP-grasp protein [Rubrobacter taiwanensis]|uniref:circularly permuted type 2 ATP-grasp protein n=1 Tax=Rubrobacter taiwanensis TaxID=185139 RepID=UPI0014042D67|nr:circularly permuted type 2 ATP-grasp protein [Rubrobacter taiwanensis]
MRFERKLPAPNEVFDAEGSPRPPYHPVLEELERMGACGWRERAERAHELLLREQHELGIPEGDRTHPTDWVPRIVPAEDWERLERGVEQRMRAINEFLRRLEAGKEEVVPQEILESSILYDTTTPNRFGEVPVRQVAFDIVAVERNGRWEYQVIEENAKMPVGLAPMTRRRRTAAGVVFPESHSRLPVRPLDGWLERLGECLRAASRAPEPVLAVVSGGPEDQFYLDHKIYAREMDAILAETHELGFDGEGYLVHRPTGRRIDVVYERVDEDRLYAELPELIECHVEGRVHVLFAPNSEVVDDKGVYAFIPEMIRTYLGEEPILQNPKTLSLADPKDRKYVLEHFEELVIKSRGGYGGKEVMIGPEESGENIERFRRLVEADPVEFIAQEVVDFSTHVICTAEGDELLLRDSYADYRVIALAPDRDTVEVVPGSLARVASPGRRLTNISSGGKMKDTWVLAG